jgi:hypothetical protein
VVEASVTKDFGTHNRTVLECEQVDKMKRVQNRFVFAKDALWFGDKHAVNDNANAIVKDLDDRIAMSSAGSSNCTSRGHFKMYRPERSRMVAIVG